MPPPEWPEKDPGDTLWYYFNWSPALRGRTSVQITDIEATVTAGDISVLQSVIVGDAGTGRVTGARPYQGTKHLLSAGTTETDCTILLVATTDETPPQVLEQSVSIRVEDQ